MPDHPLLIFPEPAHAKRVKRHGGGGKIRFPDACRQAERLVPQFQRLQQAIDQQRLALQNSALGIQPELALVLETIGPIKNFINAVRDIEGLEWLGELEIEDIPPEYGFEDEKDPQKTLSGQLFLIMTDQRAWQEIQRFFSNWQHNPDIRFPRKLTPLKHAFAHLHSIRPWNAEDRIRETGIVEDWQSRLQHGQQIVPFEVELWFRANIDHRQKAEFHLHSVIEALGGEVIQQCIIPEIAYHGILGRIPATRVPEILAQREVIFLQCEDIMHLRPIGQCAVRMPGDTPETDYQRVGEPPDLPQGDPLIALFDGLPLTGHRLLNRRLIVDDPDGFESGYQARERVHGTAMASLICHGDLEEDGNPLERPVYVRPIMQQSRGLDGQFFEAIPEGILPLDLVYRAVRRLYENEGNESPAAPSIRVINLSVCDRSHPFDRWMSSWARLLDWLSWKYNVLFVVSAGNHFHDIELNVPREYLQNLTAGEREKAVIKAIAADTRHRRLLSPAETVNGLSVAALHSDVSIPIPNTNLIDPYTQTGLPSTFNAHGPGYRRTIKPDILLPGGRQLLSERIGNTHANAILETRSYISPPGQCVASPGASGELDRIIYMRGTSNATALASRSANYLYNVIGQLRTQPCVNLPPEYDVVLLKTLLVHGADWAGAGMLFDSILRTPQNTRAFNEYVGRFLGYGSANVAKVMACTNQRATILGIGELGDGEAQEFLLPLPPSLSAVTDKRRLTVTLAWLTPVNSARQNYRIAHLWFDPKNIIAPTRICADHRAVQRGTVQHEVLEGGQAVDFQDGDAIVIKVNCRADAGDIPEPIRYGLAVTIEVAEGVNIPIYQEIKDRLRVRVPVHGGSPI